MPRFSAPVSFEGPGVFKKVYLASIAAFFVMSMHTASAQAPTANLQSCVTNYDPTIDYFPEKTGAFVADGPSDNIIFEYHKNYKIIRNRVNFSNQTLVLYQCGTPKPEKLTETGVVTFVEIPLKSYGLLDTTVLGFMDLLGTRQQAKYVDTSYLTSPCFKALETQNTTFSALGKGSDVINEQLASVNAVFTYSKNPNYTAVLTPITSDPSVKHRVEWLEFFGAFFNKETYADKVASQIWNNFECLSAGANFKANATSRPIVAFVSYTPENPAWGTNETWTISAPTYVKDFIRASGGAFVPTIAAQIKDGNVNFPNATSFLAAIKDADIVIDASEPADIATVYKRWGVTETSDYKFIKNKKIYTTGLRNAISGTDWFGSAVILVHSVLADLITIVQPSVTLTIPANAPRYFRNLDGQKTIQVTAADCISTTDPLASVTYICPIASSAVVTFVSFGTIIVMAIFSMTLVF